jgi:phosphoribosylamine--glycine ligase
MVNKKTVAVIDSGGRGAALVYKYSLSPQVKKIIAIPGNDLMQLNSKLPIITFPNLKTTDIPSIIKICEENKVDLVDVAQDSAVEAGLIDKLIENNLKVIGPSRAAGQIEWDKVWARNFMKKYKLPIPLYKACSSETEGISFIKKQTNKKWFVKASGLADGKGVIPADNNNEAITAIKSMSDFGESGSTYVIEEALIGEEFSMFAISDGKTFQVIGSAQDHKRLFNGDLGPNTGGMGCVSNPLVIDKNIFKQAKEIINTTIKGLAKEGRPYTGILYLGGMVVRKKVYVIEFNARWGDPEAQVIVPGIKNDLYKLSMSVVNNKLSKTKVKTDNKTRIVVVGSLRSDVDANNLELFGIKEILKTKDTMLFGTRVKKVKNKYIVGSGRLFHVMATGKNVTDARKTVYNAMSLLFVEGNNLHYRTDIGWRDLERIDKNIV